jgi:hypothetical protein
MTMVWAPTATMLASAARMVPSMAPPVESSMKGETPFH